MDLTRREVLKLVGVSALGAVVYYGCTFPQRELLVESPARLPEDLVSGVDNWYATLCRQCPGAEGILVRVMEGRAKKVEGNPDYPTNQGKSSARCQAAVQALYHPDRLKVPQRGDGTLVEWGAALDEVARRINQARGRDGAVVVITQPLRGHLALLVHRLTTALNARHFALEPTFQGLVAREAFRRVFGQERAPHFDIANARFLLSFGAGFLDTWLSPVYYARQFGQFRSMEGKPRGYFVQVEPRMSMTAASADEWVPVRPGSEGVLALSIAYVLIAEGMADAAAARALTGGRGLEALEPYRPEEASRATGVPAERIVALARAFGRQRPALAIAGGPAGAHTNGLFNLVAAYSLNYLVGSVGTRGGVLFNPLPPLPQAEVLSVARASSLAEWEALAEDMRSGRVEVVIVRGANPVYSLPASLGFAEALGRVPFVVSITPFPDETSRMAHLVLPEHTGLEDWGDDVPDPGPGYAAVGFQQPVVRPLYDTRGFGDILLEIGRRTGLQGVMAWPNYRAVLEDAARSLFQQGGGSVSAPDFPSFWVGLLARGGWWDTSRTSRHRPSPPSLPLPAPPAEPQGGGGFSLIPFPSVSLGEGEGAHLPWLQATPDPLTTVVWTTWAEVSPADAQRMGLREGDVLEIAGPAGRVEVPAYIHFGTPPGVVGLPLGQGHQDYTQYASGRGVNPLAIVAPARDRDTGALAWADSRVGVRKTGRRVRVPRFQGNVPAIQLPENKIIQVVRPEEV